LDCLWKAEEIAYSPKQIQKSWKDTGLFPVNLQLIEDNAIKYLGVVSEETKKESEEEQMDMLCKMVSTIIIDNSKKEAEVCQESAVTVKISFEDSLQGYSGEDIVEMNRLTNEKKKQEKLEKTSKRDEHKLKKKEKWRV